MKKYRIVEFGINKFIIEKRFLFLFWIDVCEKGNYTNTIFFNNVTDAEIKIIELKKGWISKNKVFLSDLKNNNPMTYQSFMEKFTSVKSTLQQKGVIQ